MPFCWKLQTHMGCNQVPVYCHCQVQQLLSNQQRQSLSIKDRTKADKSGYNNYTNHLKKLTHWPTSWTLALVQPSTQTLLGTQIFAVASLKLCNSLSISVRFVSSLMSFWFKFKVWILTHHSLTSGFHWILTGYLQWITFLTTVSFVHSFFQSVVLSALLKWHYSGH